MSRQGGRSQGSRSNIWTLPQDLHTPLADMSFPSDLGGSHFTSTPRTDTLPTLRLTLQSHRPGPPQQEHMNYTAIIKLVSCFITGVACDPSDQTPTHLHTLGVQITSSMLRNPFTFQPFVNPRSSKLILLRLSGFGGSGTESRWHEQKRGISETAHL